ncbi:Type II secretion system F domain protein [Methanocaldococcus infernus ME]|uniref:Type II secretion system F domain protein n=1 Tax=Methanocaldococcus infernus (strain DSM 11812 / JCM 15783 / ME) TaxID=573063 RepID=D5VT53_METIM|nr:archaellar assembly protein FlaJ [Methanocaldococcus infernus]ADG13756.1 Type II secretion system F domain protein [Methanocaldococcus infernus ME]
MLSVIIRAGLNPKEYFIKIVVPSFIVSILLIIIAIKFFSGVILYLFIVLALLILGVALAYPYILLDNLKNKINERLHIFITKFGTLSITDLNRKDLLKILSEEKEELGQLAEESRKLYVLVDKWSRSLAEACRFLAQRTPSPEFADFLDRLAFALDSGEDLKEFLIKEQDIVMDDYEAFYNRVLRSLDLYKELYVSAMTSISFLLAFAILVPFLMPFSFIFMAVAGVFLFIVTELLIYIVIKGRLPFDRLWHTGEKPTDTDKKLNKWLRISILLTVLLGAILGYAYYIGLQPIAKIPYQILVAIAFTPLAICGIISHIEESKVKRKEFVFPEFLRSLGSSVAAKGGGLKESLKYLTLHDFGPLTEDLKRLYKRIALSIDSNKAWRYFGFESCSYLIQLFSDMYARCTYLGGDPKIASEIISKNFKRIIQLRKAKYQSVQQFVGIVYGLGGGLALALFSSLSVSKAISDIYNSMNIPETVVNIIQIQPITNAQLVEYIFFITLIIYSAFSGILIKTMDGGHKYVAFLHFVITLWICAVVAYITKMLVIKLLGTGVPIY